MVLALPRLLVLSKNQQVYPMIQWYWIKTVFLFSLTDRVPVKGNCVDSGASLVAETLRKILLYYEFQLSLLIMEFLLLENP